MTKTIKTLIQDIYKLLETNDPGVKIDIPKRDSEDKGGLRASKIGLPNRKLWYSVNKPELAEPFTGSTLLKFKYGHTIEDMVLSLAEQAGHKVELRQQEVSIAGVPGHIDAIIDGVLIDVKSASSFQYKKFLTGSIDNDDAFGYIDQLQFYLSALQDREELQVKGEAAFLCINKEDGSMCLHFVKRKDIDVTKEVETKKHMVSNPLVPNEKCYKDVPMGTSGNRVLGTQCSYCAFKKECWKDSNGGLGLIPYSYSNSIKYFTNINKPPKVDKHEAF